MSKKSKRSSTPTPTKKTARKKAGTAKKISRKAATSAARAKKKSAKKKTATGASATRAGAPRSIARKKVAAAQAAIGSTTTQAKRAAAKRSFPREFLWGAATAATQIDGGDTASDWYHWSTQPERIEDGKSCAVACDHWNRYEEDFRLLGQLGLNSYRFGIDWSRFEPSPGEWQTKNVEQLRAMLDSLRRKNIRPLLTLKHFAIPQWWLERGGWTKEENIEHFVRFAERIVAEIGDLVHEYITFNEPNVYSLFGYIDGRWPPGHSGIRGYFESQMCLRNMLLAHFRLYDSIREVHLQSNWPVPQISIAKHVRVFDPLRPESAWDRDRCHEAERRFNHIFCDAIDSGCMPRPLGSGERVHPGNAWDFLGLNYYSRTLIGFSILAPHILFMKAEPNGRQDGPTNDMGWEIYPEGLTRVLKDFYHRYRLPIRITENGIAAVNDEQRESYILSHLAAVKKAMDEGVPVEGYYHWSFLDNFEWAEGYIPRFGLVGVDYETQQRTIKPSARRYGRIARTGVL